MPQGLTSSSTVTQGLSWLGTLPDDDRAPSKRPARWPSTRGGHQSLQGPGQSPPQPSPVDCSHAPAVGTQPATCRAASGGKPSHPGEGRVTRVHPYPPRRDRPASEPDPFWDTVREPGITKMLSTASSGGWHTLQLPCWERAQVGLHPTVRGNSLQLSYNLLPTNSNPGHPKLTPREYTRPRAKGSSLGEEGDTSPSHPVQSLQGGGGGQHPKAVAPPGVWCVLRECPCVWSMSAKPRPSVCPRHRDTLLSPPGPAAVTWARLSRADQLHARGRQDPRRAI